MEKANILRLIASLCLFFGNIINLLNIWIKIPLVWSACSVPLLLAAIVLYGISFKKSKDNKQDNEQK